MVCLLYSSHFISLLPLLVNIPAKLHVQHNCSVLTVDERRGFVSYIEAKYKAALNISESASGFSSAAGSTCRRKKNHFAKVDNKSGSIAKKQFQLTAKGHVQIVSMHAPRYQGCKRNRFRVCLKLKVKVTYDILT